MNLMKNIVILFVVLTIAFVIIPLPAFLLDFMFILSISVSLTILLITMYIRGPLEFSIFPSLLLITTLLRLALNISSTRLILSNQGQAGKVIETFGTFVLGGNAVVGFIVFVIIFIVQFIVITKGSERIAEVSARFTLDAMPGKQMAIDADLSSGIIDEEEAKMRRSDIQREAEFFGAMDGATKLVKGDAIAGIIIALVNLIAGTVIGLVQGGMTFTEVLAVYTIATVGDGLVAQLPAIMLSTATGMIVTRAASEGNLDEEVKKQVLAQPRVLVITGFVVMAMLLIPGSPKAQILAIGLSLTAFGVALQRAESRQELHESREELLAALPEETSEIDYYRNIDNVYELLGVEPIEMEFGYSLLPLVDEESGGNFIDRIVLLRKQFATDLGVIVPTVRLRDNGLISPNQYIIKIKGEEVSRGDILVDYYLALDPGGTSGDIDGIETTEPAYGIPAKWVTEEEKDVAEMYGFTIIDCVSVIVTHLSEIIKKNIHELLTRQDVNNLLQNVSKINPAIVEDVVPECVSVSNLQKILTNLLREGVPIKDMESILETLGEYGRNVQDPDLLTEYARQRLKRTITSQYADGHSIKVVTLDQSIEETILSSTKQSDFGTYLALEPSNVQNIVEGVAEKMGELKGLVSQPIVLTSPVVRLYFKRLTEQFMPELTVLSFDEIEPSIQIQGIGVIQVQE